MRLLNAEQTALALTGYVALYGTLQLAVGARMLFKEYRAEHPATQLSMSWREQMDRLPAAAGSVHAAQQACGHDGMCKACAAEARCFDFTVEGQLAQVRASRTPAIVRTLRAASVLQAATTGAQRVA